jgi:hypothetical protein
MEWFSRIEIHREPSILLGTSTKQQTWILAAIPCREDVVSQVSELRDFCGNLSIVATTVEGVGDFPRVFHRNNGQLLVFEGRETPILRRSLHVRNIYFSGTSAEFWVDSFGEYLSRSSHIHHESTFVKCISSNSPRFFSVVLIDGMTVGDIASSLKVSPHAHVVRVRFQDLIIECSFQEAPPVAMLRKAFMRSFNRKLDRSDVVCGMPDAHPRITSSSNDDDFKRINFSLWTWPLIGLCVLVAGVMLSAFK